MNTLTSYIVIAVVVLNIAGCFFLLRWTATKRAENASQVGPEIHNEAEKETTGHVWDGDLTEYNNPLPRWWLNMFYLSIAFAVGYLLLYPGLGNIAGYFRWTSAHEHDVMAKAERETYLAAFAPYRETPIEQLMGDATAMRMGQSIFNNSCAACHGSDARGAKGFPNLTDTDWLYGGEPEVIQATLREGRQGVMPAWKAAVGEAGVAELVAYVRQLSASTVASEPLATAGKARYEMFCIACHGPEGKGNQALGAPNISDQIWLYGGDVQTLTETIANGRGGVMPSQKANLNEDQIRVMSAWVYAQSHKAGETSSGQAANPATP